MAKLSVRNCSSSSKRKGRWVGLVKLKFMVEKLQKSLLMVRSNNKSSSNYDEYDEGCNSKYVPDDVKEGHFAVIADEGGKEPKRFVMPLSCLTNPTFFRLLEQAKEEYGFYHKGAVTIPCRPSVLERILVEQQWQQDQEGVSESWNSVLLGLLTRIFNFYLCSSGEDACVPPAKMHFSGPSIATQMIKKCYDIRGTVLLLQSCDMIATVLTPGLTSRYATLLASGADLLGEGGGHVPPLKFQILYTSV